VGRHQAHGEGAEHPEGDCNEYPSRCRPHPAVQCPPDRRVPLAPLPPLFRTGSALSADPI
jgi:hypothetical protein